MNNSEIKQLLILQIMYNTYLRALFQLDQVEQRERDIAVVASNFLPSEDAICIVPKYAVNSMDVDEDDQYFMSDSNVNTKKAVNSMDVDEDDQYFMSDSNVNTKKGKAVSSLNSDSENDFMPSRKLVKSVNSMDVDEDDQYFMSDSNVNTKKGTKAAAKSVSNRPTKKKRIVDSDENYESY
ncbi:hypothetical protein V9T40_007264 [Parthenolecanium corni]|uniref:Uncharacterized protein n=1 Tax=Parthenolecanium corni TaxID=536013 RepID=A0AAN9YAL7_9HEMI